MEKKTKILVVDDDKDYADAIRLILETKRYDVTTAHDKDDGLEKIKDANPDLIVLDVMMGNQAAGLLFARKIRSKKNPDFAAYSNIPILVLTGIREQTGFYFIGEPKHPVFFPIDEIVEKPVKPEVLLEKVEKLLLQARGPAGKKEAEEGDHG